MLRTEQRNPRTDGLDTLGTAGILAALSDEDMLVAGAVRAVIPAIAQAVDIAVDRLQRGGRLLYVGAGSSGRLCIVDAASCSSTFGVSRETVQAIVAGKGHRSSPEIAAEDDVEAAVADISAINAGPDDIVVGVAASGTTPYVLAAVRTCSERGSATICLSANPGTPLCTACDVSIVPDTGPEALTGSTRLKAGTAQKMVLNMLSTATMVRLGKVYSNLMVDFVPSNFKLERRAVRIVAMASGASLEGASKALEVAGNVKTAILMARSGLSESQCVEALARCGGRLREALETLGET